MSKQIKLIGLLCCFLAARVQSKPLFETPDSNRSPCVAVIHFERVDDLIYLPVTVNGSRPLRFFLDGGSSSCVIDPTVIKELGIKSGGSGIIHGAGSGEIHVTYTDSLTFGFSSTTLGVSKATIIDLSGSVPGQKFDGLIGYDFFAKYVVEVDYKHNILRLYQPQTFRYTGHGAILPITFIRKLVHINGEVKIAGHPSELHSYLVDTGSGDAIDDTLIARSAAAKTDGVGGVGLGKTFKVTVGSVEWLKLDKYTIRNLQGTSGSQAIGNGLLHNYDVYFDYFRKRMILE